MTATERNALKGAVDGLHANLMWYVINAHDMPTSELLDHLLFDVEVFKRRIGWMLDRDAMLRADVAEDA